MARRFFIFRSNWRSGDGLGETSIFNLALIGISVPIYIHVPTPHTSISRFEYWYSGARSPCPRYRNTATVVSIILTLQYQITIIILCSKLYRCIKWRSLRHQHRENVYLLIPLYNTILSRIPHQFSALCIRTRMPILDISTYSEIEVVGKKL